MNQDEYRDYEEKRRTRRVHKQRIYPHYRGAQAQVRLRDLTPIDPRPHNSA